MLPNQQDSEASAGQFSTSSYLPCAPTIGPTFRKTPTPLPFSREINYINCPRVDHIVKQENMSL